MSPRRRALARRLGSVATGALLLHGCATHVVPPPEGERGSIAVRPGRAGAVIAAPHGGSDPRTGELAAELARRTGFGLVVANGVAAQDAGAAAGGARYHVNRPPQGVPGRAPAGEARRVDEAYEQRVREAARGRLAFYAEIHGDRRSDAVGPIEIATAGVQAADARRLRVLLELVRDAHLRAHPGAPRLDARVAPADPAVFGILPPPGRALHIALPRAARIEWRRVYTAILADFLAQAAALPPIR